MPTYLRLIIMLGEMIGLLIFSFIRCSKSFKIYKKEKKNDVNRSDLKLLITFYAICNSIVLFVFIFSFQSYFFLCYNKLILLTIAVFASFLPFIILKNIDKHNGISTIVLFVFCVGMVTTGVVTIYSLCAPSQLIQFKTCIKEEKYIETINPEIKLTDKSKIGHYLYGSGDVYNYIFFYKDSNGNWCKVDEPIEDAIELSSSESSYVEKKVTTKTILNFELNEADDNYITKEETVSYKLYYNPNEVIDITD